MGDFTTRRRSAKVRLGNTSVAKRHAFKKRTGFKTHLWTHMSGGRMRAVIPVLRDVAVFKTSASPHRYSACTVCWCRGGSHVRVPKWELNTRNSKGEKIQH